MKRHYVLGAILACCMTSLGARAAEPGFYLGIEAGQSRAQVGTGSNVVALQGVVTSTSTDERDTALGFYVGYAMSRHFAIEFSYANLGDSVHVFERDLVSPPVPVPSLRPGSGTPTFAVGVPNPGAFPGPAFIVPEREQTTIDSQSFALTLVGRYPLTERFAFLGRTGVSAHLLEADLRFWFGEQGGTARIGNRDESAGAALVGAGVEWNFHPNWHLRAEVQRHFMLEDATFINNVQRGDVTTLAAGIGYRF